jgi:hypothetical protein
VSFSGRFKNLKICKKDLSRIMIFFLNFKKLYGTLLRLLRKKDIYRRKRVKFRFNFGIFCEMLRVKLWNSDKNPVKFQLKFWYFHFDNLCEMITIFVKYTVIYIQFVCEFALENARIAVLELQKWNNFLGEDPQTPVFSRNLVWQCKSITRSFIIIITL